MVEIGEIFTLWSGLCTKIRIKLDLVDGYANTVQLNFEKFLNETDIPKLKVFFTSEDNSGMDSFKENFDKVFPSHLFHMELLT